MVKAELTDEAERERTISRAEILARLQDRALMILNVMPKETFAEGHIPESINLPVADIESKAHQLISNFNQKIAIYCAGPT